MNLIVMNYRCKGNNTTEHLEAILICDDRKQLAESLDCFLKYVGKPHYVETPRGGNMQFIEDIFRQIYGTVVSEVNWEDYPWG